MTGELAPIVESAERLCRTLERIGDALSALDVDTLLETEETLGCLLAAIRHKGLVEDRAAFESLVERGRAGRLRCRRLAFTTASRSRLSVHTGIEADDLDSEHLRGAVSGPSIEAT